MARMRVAFLGVLAPLLGVADVTAEPLAAQEPLGAGVRARLADPSALPEEGLRVIVKLRDPATRSPSRAGWRQGIASRQASVLAGLPRGARGLRMRHRHRMLNGFAGSADRATLAALAADPRVERVYLDRPVFASLAEGRVLVGGEPARIKGYDGTGVTVAILDSGVDTNHPSLANDLVAEQCFCDDHPSPSLGCCPGGGPVQSGAGAAEDDDGHGTAVAGIVTGDQGVLSQSLASRSKIVAVKVLDDDGNGSFSDVDAGLDWVLDNLGTTPVSIVNLSLGDGAEYTNPATFPCTGSLTSLAISSLVAAGVTVVAASGNEAHDAGISLPACAPDAISVGGVYDAALGTVNWCGFGPSCQPYLCTDSGTQADDFVCHSNAGPMLDVLAPNWRTVTANIGGGTQAFGGTSAATPYVAAEAALLYQADPSVTPAQVRQLLTSHGPMISHPVTAAQYRRADVAAALTELVGGPDSDGDGVPDDGDGSGTAGDDPCEDGEVVLCDDSCPADPDASQADADGDGVGDVCDVVCSNGLDDDQDGFIDDLDPGCLDPLYPFEDPQCNDGEDNDLDGDIDLLDDQCTFAFQNNEAPPMGCGLGGELVLLLPVLQALRRRQGRAAPRG